MGEMRGHLTGSTGTTIKPRTPPPIIPIIRRKAVVNTDIMPSIAKDEGGIAKDEGIAAEAAAISPSLSPVVDPSPTPVPPPIPKLLPIPTSSSIPPSPIQSPTAKPQTLEELRKRRLAYFDSVRTK
jgi:hypothetical protein